MKPYLHFSSTTLVAEIFRLPQHWYGIQKLAVLPQPASTTRIWYKLASVSIASTNRISTKQLVSAGSSIQTEFPRQFCFHCLFTIFVLLSSRSFGCAVFLFRYHDRLKYVIPHRNDKATVKARTTTKCFDCWLSHVRRIALLPPSFVCLHHSDNRFHRYPYRNKPKQFKQKFNYRRPVF